MPPSNTGVCLNAEEAALVQQVNAYRQQNGRAALPASWWLSTTGQWHAWDLTVNAPYGGACNLHSWSGARPTLWQAVCYTADHAQAAQMWAKPRQISQGTPPGNPIYTGNGYENAAQAGSQITAAVALALWQASPAHREVILQQGVWAGINFRGLGVGIVGGHAVLWFGDGVDPSGTMPSCAVPPSIFATGFE
ncbi:MAG: CAP domain-containing protein [Xanthomonadales bacterium]|nr:hypothetical protein [Xanthomonadales bacterium]MCC6593962.1 CAP domain-containing protein [Xanthomonadales bacterium]MCE7930942.1 CAP domain-containing protein [Xanthomonadales bacterium PRO6]